MSGLHENSAAEVGRLRYGSFWLRISGLHILWLKSPVLVQIDACDGYAEALRRSEMRLLPKADVAVAPAGNTALQLGW